MVESHDPIKLSAPPDRNGRIRIGNAYPRCRSRRAKMAFGYLWWGRQVRMTRLLFTLSLPVCFCFVNPQLHNSFSCSNLRTPQPTSALNRSWQVIANLQRYYGCSEGILLIGTTGQECGRDYGVDRDVARSFGIILRHSTSRS